MTKQYDDKTINLAKQMAAFSLRYWRRKGRRVADGLKWEDLTEDNRAIMLMLAKRFGKQ